MRNFALTLLFLANTLAFAQQEVVGVVNDRSFDVRPQMKMDDTLNLPFRDDFSGESSIPSIRRWTDAKVHVNNTFPIDQWSRGVATFDGLNESGKAYDFSNSRSDTLADVLTSRYFDLSAETSPYLNFLYQEGGWGEEPETDDSLVVDFWNVDSARWERVWSVRGGEFVNNEWTWASVSANDPKWLKDGFRFRIGTYGARNGGYDVWNLDYLSFEANRTAQDTGVEDPAITKQHPVLTRDFKLIPWFHLGSAQFRSNFNLLYRRNGPVPVGGWSLNLGKYRLFQDGIEIDTRLSVPVITNLDHNVELSYTVPINTNAINTSPGAPTKLEVQGWFDGEAVGVRKNDSIYMAQEFDNTYALDDGSAERVYGLTQGDSYILYRFQPLVSDTLKGFRMYFGQADNDIIEEEFKIVIYSFQNNAPGNILYESDSIYNPQYVGANNQFANYVLDTSGIWINGTVYIGLKQMSNIPLTIGLDRNTDGDTTIVYGDGVNWYPSNEMGALMIRPYFRYHPNDLSVETPKRVSENFIVYPNPVDNEVYVDFNAVEANYQVLDMHGRVVLNGTINAGNRILMGELQPGMYLLQLQSGHWIEVKKLILR